MSFTEIFQRIHDGAVQTSLPEWTAVISALLYVILAARENILCWLFGIISSSIYIFICFKAELFLETGLQVFYVIMGAYGWWQWIRNKGTHDYVPIIEWNLRKQLPLLLSGAAVGVLLGFLFANYTSAAQPWLDAFITSYSLAATWMVTKKILENWIYWIIIDALCIYLYSQRGLYLSSLLFTLYTILAAYGFIAWKKELKASSA